MMMKRPVKRIINPPSEGLIAIPVKSNPMSNEKRADLGVTISSDCLNYDDPDILTEDAVGRNLRSRH